MSIPLYIPALSSIFLCFVVPRYLSFLILSNFVMPHINILVSATSNFFSCAFLTAHVSALFIIAVLTTVPCTLVTSIVHLGGYLHSFRVVSTLSQPSTLSSWSHWPRGPVDLKSYWPPKNPLAPIFSNDVNPSKTVVDIKTSK